MKEYGMIMITLTTLHISLLFNLAEENQPIPKNYSGFISTQLRTAYWCFFAIGAYNIILFNPSKGTASIYESLISSFLN